MSAWQDIHSLVNPNNILPFQNFEGRALKRYFIKGTPNIDWNDRAA
jgi:hypothetical protein